MEVFDNYKKYREFKPDYKEWKQQQDLLEAKRLEYLKQNPDKVNQEDVQRGKALLHAIDVMDEFSQSNAEDMEVATEFASGLALETATFVGMGLGLGASRIPAVAKRMEKFVGISMKKNIAVSLIPTLIGAVTGMLAAIPIMSWAAKVQVSASRKGRFEAMRKDLQKPNTFAVLTEEQQKKVNEEASKMPTDKEMKKALKKNQGMNMNMGECISTLKKLKKEEKDYKSQKAEFEKLINAHEQNFNKEINEKDIEKAKKDQQLLANLVQKIDIASQDYAENIELATNLASIAMLGSGALAGWIANKIAKLCKANPNGFAVQKLPLIVGFAIALPISIFAAKIQKQGSRVGRFNVKQELSKNPENFAYVDDKDAQKINIEQPQEQKKPNIFKFLIQAYKDNKAYNNNLKTQGIEEKKRHKVMENLELSDEQLKDAKSLQHNTFKTFNKVDEKSQTYSESVEAVGEITKLPLSYISSLLGLGVGALFAKKDIKALFDANVMPQFAEYVKMGLKFMGGMFVTMLPIMGLEVFVTKEQKKASRIADMLAIKEMNDYRHYVDYNNLTDSQKTTETVTKEQSSSTGHKSLLDMMMKKYNN